LANDRILQLDYGGGGEATRFVCGFLHCDQRFNPLIGALPTMLCVCGRDSAGQGEPSEVETAKRPGVVLVDAGGWLASTLRHTIEEADGMYPGSSAMLARLTELLYVEVLRRYMQRLPSGHTSWLAGVKDPEVGRALRLLHARPERQWTVEDLAREVGASRSGLAQRFTELAGEAPMRYLTGWRIQLAKHLILQAGLPIAEVADRVGYESEAAFNRAFKRHVGEPPVAWRKKSS
jgi:AraC family transcriptional regulator, alkane utilization regulator